MRYLLLLVLLASSCSANFVLNPSFELPGIDRDFAADWEIDPVSAQWTRVLGSTYGGGVDGEWVLRVDANNSFEDELLPAVASNSGEIPAGPHSISIWAKARGYKSTLLVFGVEDQRVEFWLLPDDQWHNFTGVFTSTENAPLIIGAWNYGDDAVFLDAIVVSPEPANWLVLLGGVLCLSSSIVRKQLKRL